MHINNAPLPLYDDTKAGLNWGRIPGYIRLNNTSDRRGWYWEHGFEAQKGIDEKIASGCARLAIKRSRIRCTYSLPGVLRTSTTCSNITTLIRMVSQRRLDLPYHLRSLCLSVQSSHLQFRNCHTSVTTGHVTLTSVPTSYPTEDSAWRFSQVIEAGITTPAASCQFKQQHRELSDAPREEGQEDWPGR